MVIVSDPENSSPSMSLPDSVSSPGPDSVGVQPFVHVHGGDNASIGELTHDEEVSLGLHALEVACAAVTDRHAGNLVLEEPESDVRIACVL